MAKAKRNGKKKGRDRESRSWEPFAVGVLAVGLVAVIFIMTNRGNESETPPKQVTPPSPVTSTAPTTSPITPMDVARADRIDVDTAKRMLDEGRAITIDVRDVQSYAAGHIPGALQIPLQYVAGEVPWFPRDRMIIPYCT